MAIELTLPIRYYEKNLIFFNDFGDYFFIDCNYFLDHLAKLCESMSYERNLKIIISLNVLSFLI